MRVAGQLSAFSTLFYTLDGDAWRRDDNKSVYKVSVEEETRVRPQLR